jgi:hypothetical protein
MGRVFAQNLEGWSFDRFVRRFLILVFVYHVMEEALSLFIVVVNHIVHMLYPGTGYGMSLGAGLMAQLIMLSPGLFEKLIFGTILGPIHFITAGLLFIVLAIRTMYIYGFYALAPFFLALVVVDVGIFSRLRSFALKFFQGFLVVTFAGMFIAGILASGSVLAGGAAHTLSLDDGGAGGLQDGTNVDAYVQTQYDALEEDPRGGQGGSLSGPSAAAQYVDALFQYVIFYASIWTAIALGVAALPLGMSHRVTRNASRIKRRAVRHLGAPPLRGDLRVRSKYRSKRAAYGGDSLDPDNVTVVHSDQGAYIRGEAALPYHHSFFASEDDQPEYLNASEINAEDLPKMVEEHNKPVTVEAEIVSISTSSQDGIAKTGYILDNTGMTRFVIRDDNEFASLSPGDTLRFEDAGVMAYGDSRALVLDTDTLVTGVDGEVDVQNISIDEIDEEGRKVETEAEVVSVGKPDSDSLNQIATLRDEHGEITVLVDNSFDGTLEKGKAYHIDEAITIQGRDDDEVIVKLGATSEAHEKRGDVISPTETGIGQITDPEEKVAVSGEVVNCISPDSGRIKQIYWIQDQTGTIKVTHWADSDTPELEEGMHYQMDGAWTTEDDYSDGELALELRGSESISQSGYVSPDTNAEDIDTDGERVQFEGEVVSTSDPDTDDIEQTAILRDETGTVRVVQWADGDHNPLEEGEQYTLKNARVHAREDTAMTENERTHELSLDGRTGVFGEDATGGDGSPASSTEDAPGEAGHRSGEDNESNAEGDEQDTMNLIADSGAPYSGEAPGENGEPRRPEESPSTTISSIFSESVSSLRDVNPFGPDDDGLPDPTTNAKGEYLSLSPTETDSTHTKADDTNDTRS